MIFCRPMPVRSMEVAVVTCIRKESLRPNKRLRTSEATSSQDICKEEESTAVSCDEQTQDEVIAGDKPKPKRNWESWEVKDMNIFFEALSEYGKDFDKIHAHMKHKLRHETKNKDQIRHFYYRTWNKISKHLSCQLDKEKRAANELFCLICYGELRKKGIKGYSKKQINKIEELLTQKWTTIRYRGRNIKLKPPSCKALKRLQDTDSIKEKHVQNPQNKEHDIPSQLCIELIPASNGTWCAVQKSANNPRLRFSYVDSKLKLNYIVQALRKKFKGSLLLADSPDITVSPINLNDVNEDLLHELLKNNENETKQHSAPCNIDLTSTVATTPKRTKGNGNQPKIPETGENTQGSTTLQSNENHNEDGNEINNFLSPCPNSNESLLFSHSTSSSSPNQEIEREPGCSKSPERTVSWDAESISSITLSSLYLVLGKPDVLRLKYLFKRKNRSFVLGNGLDDDVTGSTPAGSIRRLMTIVSAEKKQILTPTKKAKPAKKPVSPQTGSPSISTYIPICPTTVTTPPASKPLISIKASPEKMLPPKDINLPALRKRGRNPNLKPVNIVRRKLIPKPLNMGGTKTLVPGAVAVNIVPQPAQLVQFAQLPPVSAQLMNSGNAAVSTATVAGTPNSPQNTQNKVASTSPDILSKVVAQTLQGIDSRVQVLDEGFVGGTNLLKETSHPIQLSQLIHLQDSNSSTTWSTMLSEMDLSFLNSGHSNQSRQTMDLHSKKEADDTEKKTNVSVSSTKNGLFSNNLHSKSSSVFDTPEDSVGSFSHLHLSRDSLLATTTSSFVATTDSHCKLSVLTTPVKDSLKTPTKIDNVNKENVCNVRIPSPPFETNSWLTSEVADISIGGIIGEITKEQKISLSNNVGSHLDCMLDENSVDFVNRFKDLAAKMSTNIDSSTSQQDASKREINFKNENVTSRLGSGGSASYDHILQGSTELSQSAKDVPMPIYHAEESTGPLDGLAFVLPTSDSGSSSDSVKGFSVGQ